MVAKVCDSIMGTGKTSATITYMNEHPEKKFIYITPYLDESKRIKDGCPDRRFVMPIKKQSDDKTKMSKTVHTAQLIKEGRDIATTHQAFMRYTDEMLDDIAAQGYTLVIDESITVLEGYDISPADIQLLATSGYVSYENGVYSRTDKPYGGRWASDILKFMSYRDLIEMVDEDKVSLYYWALPPKMLLAFEEVFVLTYLFEGQGIHHFFELNNIDYEYIGVEKREDGIFAFGDYPGYVPDYVYDLKNKIHVVDEEKINEIGEDEYALSKTKYADGKVDERQIKNNLHNYYANKTSATGCDERMVGMYKDYYGKIKGKGYTSSIMPFNMRATNKYKKCRSLSYMVNVYMPVGDKLFYTNHGIQVDEDLYALSVLVQWIWRSAIREGEEIDLYLPSSRMRRIFNNWVNGLVREEVPA